jgi:hypothetical protein
VKPEKATLPTSRKTRNSDSDNVEQIFIGQKVLESSRWKLEASANASHLPKKKRIGKFEWWLMKLQGPTYSKILG